MINFVNAKIQGEKNIILQQERQGEKMLRATNIHWDCDNEDILVSLPDEVDIPEDVEEEQVEDYLSDLVGYCVYSYNICEGFER